MINGIINIGPISKNIEGISMLNIADTPMNIQYPNIIINNNDNICVV